MEEVQFTKYTLELVLKESEKLLDAISNSIKATVNKSYILISACIPVVSYSYFKLLDKEYNYLVLLIGFIISAVLVFKNLLPNKIQLKGVISKEFLSDYFNEYKDEELDKNILQVLMKKYDLDIIDNKDVVNTMSKRFLNSFYCMLSSMLIFIIVSLFC